MSCFGGTSAPVAFGGVLGFLEALNSYKIDYDWFFELRAVSQNRPGIRVGEIFGGVLPWHLPAHRRHTRNSEGAVWER